MSGLRAITVPPFQELITRTLGLPPAGSQGLVSFRYRFCAPDMGSDRCGKALFWLAMSGHARAVSLDIPVSPKMFSIFRSSNAALPNSPFSRGTGARLVCLGDARR